MSVFTSGIYTKEITDAFAFSVTLDANGAVSTVDGPRISTLGAAPAAGDNIGSVVLRRDAGAVGLYFNLTGGAAWAGFTFNNSGVMTLQNAALAGAPAGEVATDAVGMAVEANVVIDGGTASSPYDITLPSNATNYEVIDVTVQCRAADAGGTAQVQTGAGGAISDAIACAVDTTVARAGTINDANSTIAGGGTLRVVFAGGSAAGRGLVTVKMLPRA